MNTIRSLVVLLLLSPLLPAQAPKTKTGVEVEMQLAVVSTQALEKMIRENPKKFKSTEKGGGLVEKMSAAELRKLTVDLIESCDGSVVSLPKQTVVDGRTATVHSGEPRARTFTTTVENAKGKNVTAAELEFVNAGTTLTVSPKVATDRKSVELGLRYNHSWFDTPVVMTPIATQTKPNQDENAVNETVIYRYKTTPMNTNAIETKLKLTDTSSAVLQMSIHKVAMDDANIGIPVLNQIPYMDRLFRNTTNRTTHQTVMLFVTTKVVEIPASVVLVDDYNKAVAEGRLDEAKELAAQALAADPKCFARMVREVTISQPHQKPFSTK